MHKRHIPLLLSTALAAAIAAPAAFAQDAKTQQAPPQEASAAAPQSGQEAEPAKKIWSELDADGNGSLNVGEAGALQSLAKVFAQADSDGNGELTGQEYKVWWSANAGAKAGKD